MTLRDVCNALEAADRAIAQVEPKLRDALNWLEHIKTAIKGIERAFMPTAGTETKEVLPDPPKFNPCYKSVPDTEFICDLPEGHVGPHQGTTQMPF